MSDVFTVFLNKDNDEIIFFFWGGGSALNSLKHENRAVSQLNSNQVQVHKRKNRKTKEKVKTP